MNITDYLNEIKRIIHNVQKDGLPESELTVITKLLNKYNRESATGLFSTKKVTSTRLFQELFAMTLTAATNGKRIRLILDRIILLAPTLKGDDEIFALLSAFVSYYPKYLKYLKPIEHKLNPDYSWLSEEVKYIDPPPLQLTVVSQNESGRFNEIIVDFIDIGRAIKVEEFDLKPYFKAVSSQKIASFLQQLIDFLYMKDDLIANNAVVILFQMCSLSLIKDHQQKLILALYQLELRNFQNHQLGLRDIQRDLVVKTFLKLNIGAQDAYNYLEIFLSENNAGTSEVYSIILDDIPALCRLLSPSQQNKIIDKLYLKLTEKESAASAGDNLETYLRKNNMYCYVIASILSTASAHLKNKIIGFLYQLVLKGLVSNLFGWIHFCKSIIRIDFGIKSLFKNAIIAASEEQVKGFEIIIVTVLEWGRQFEARGLIRLPSFVIGVVSAPLREKIITGALNQIKQGFCNINDFWVNIRYLSIAQKEAFVNCLIDMMQSDFGGISIKFTAMEVLSNLMCTVQTLEELQQLINRLNKDFFIIREFKHVVDKPLEIVTKHWTYDYSFVQIIDRILNNAQIIKKLEMSPVLGQITTFLMAVRLRELEGYGYEFALHSSRQLTCLKKLYLISTHDDQKKIGVFIKETTHFVHTRVMEWGDDLLVIDGPGYEEKISLLTEGIMKGWDITAAYKAMVLDEMSSALEEFDPVAFPCGVRALVASYRFSSS